MQTDPFVEASSYWHQTSTPLPLATDLPVTADVVVIGGGLLGASTCYWLAKAGLAPVMLEREKLAHGATGRNGGFVAVGTAEAYPAAIERLGHESAHDIMALTYDSQQLLRQVLNEEKIACNYREPGNLSLALGAEQFARLERSVAALQADGFAATLLDREQVKQFIATELSPEIVGGKFIPDQGLVHSARLVQGLAEAAQRHGARLYNASVSRIESVESTLRIITEQGEVQAGAVIVAVNAWTGEILPELASLITPVRGQVLAYAPMWPVFKVGMSASVTATGEYWQQAVDGTIVLGGCRTAAAGSDVGIQGSEWDRPTLEVQAALGQVFPRLFPSLCGLRIVRRWAGLMGFTRDYVPIADQVPGIAGAWVVGGFSGHGMPFGMRLGQLLAEAVVAGKAPGGLRPFRIDRPTLVE